MPTDHGVALLRGPRFRSPTREESYEVLRDLGIYDTDDSAGYMTRGQAALAVGALLGYMNLPLPAAGSDMFTDIASSPYRVHINRLARASIVFGFAGGTFRPNDLLIRGQFASIVVRAAGRYIPLPTPSRDYFTDDNNSVHENNINIAAELKLMSGAGTRFGVTQRLTRLYSAQVLQRLNRILGGNLLADRDTFDDPNALYTDDIFSVAPEGGFYMSPAPLDWGDSTLPDVDIWTLV